MERTTTRAAGYRSSVQRTLATAELPEGSPLRRYLRQAVAELPDKVAAQLPYDVLALTSLRHFVDHQQYMEVVRASLLVSIGYDVHQSLLHFDALMQRVKVPLDMLRLMSRDQLRAEFGLLGSLVADTLVSPDEQPYLHAMLVGDDPNAVDPKYGEFYMKAELDTNVLLRSNAPALSFAPATGSLHPLTQQEARYLYERNTGQELPRNTINRNVIEEILCRAPTRSP